MSFHTKTIGGALLISGTCIGAGMLALPIITAQYGVLGALLASVIAWSFMYYTGLMVLEANLWFEDNANYVTMVKAVLGPIPKYLTWIGFLLLLYALITSYVIGTSNQLADLLTRCCHILINSRQSCLLISALFAGVIFGGIALVDHVNRYITGGVVVSFLLLMFMLTPHINIDLFQAARNYNILYALPVIFTSYGYHVVLPSVRHHLHGNVRRLKRAILIGSLLPCIIYVFWQIAIFGIIPMDGPNGMISLLQTAKPSVALGNHLATSLNQQAVRTGFRFFTFFAVASSFLGIAVSLFDFIADGLKIKRNVYGKLFISALVFIPPYFISATYPDAFITALTYAGVIVALIHGFLPASLVYVGRAKGKKGPMRVKGGAPILISTMVTSLVIVGYEVCRLL